MSAVEHKTVGVMGGMGPAATIEFMRHVAAMTVATPVRMLVDCNPTLSDVSSSILGEGPSCADALARMAFGLEASGAQLVVLACNAAHHYEDHIREALGIPFISMIEVVAAGAAECRTLGLLAAQSCLVSGVYQRALAAYGVSTLTLAAADTEAFNAALAAIRAGDMGRRQRDSMLKAIKLLANAGAEAVILGCTEIPLVVGPSDTDIRLIDPAAELARAVVARATSRQIGLVR